MKNKLKEEYAERLGVDTDKSDLGKVARKLKRRAPAVPTYEDPVLELKLLVNQHVALTKAAVANTNMANDKKRDTGEMMPCRLPLDTQVALNGLVKDVLKKRAKMLEREMTIQLRRFDVYKLFLSKVYGMGPVTAAYLLAEVDIEKAVKPSNLRRYCGLAVIDGRLERPQAGRVNAYSKKMRTALFNMFTAMWRNGVGRSTTSKYLDIWRNVKQRELHSPRVHDGKISLNEREVSAKQHSHKKGWHKAADIFLYDLYTVWRSINGLPAWVTYQEGKLTKVEHKTGIPITNEWRHLSIEDALEIVGDVGGRPFSWPKGSEDESMPDEALDVEEAAE